MEQPYMTMQIVSLVQMSYRKHLAEKVDKIRGNTNPRARRRK